VEEKDNTDYKYVINPFRLSLIALNIFIIGIPDGVVVAFVTLMNNNMSGVVKF
jgi:hypothetical protein